MDWIHKYQLFLFDLDGLLVNTEEIHFRAYVAMCKARGYHFPLTFSEYFRMAQQDSKAPEKYIYSTFPELYKTEPNWHVLYAEKKRAFLDILEREPAPLMPGAELLLQTLEAANKKRCVVTHSSKELVAVLTMQNRVLQSIPYWFTREDYVLPKPAPDGYLKAIESLASPKDTIIGFEDSDRGLRSLLATPAQAVLVNSIDTELCIRYQRQGVPTFSSLDQVCYHFPDNLYS